MLYATVRPTSRGIDSFCLNDAVLFSAIDLRPAYCPMPSLRPSL